MKMTLLSGVRLRLTGWYIGTIAIILMFFSTVVFFSLRQMLLSQIAQESSMHISEVHQAILDAVAGANDDLSDFTEFDPSRIFRIEKNGTLLLETPAWKYAGFDKFEKKIFSGKLWQKSNEHLYHVSQSHFMQGTDSYQIYTALDITLIVHYLHLLSMILALGIPASLLLIIIGGIFFTQRILKPIQEITCAASAISAHNLNERLPVVNSNDEFGRLATVFNDLFSRLNRSFEELRRFTADASHELRTPLTAIRSVGETALQSDLSAEGYREVIGSILEEVDRQRNLVENLLTLARSDANQVHLRPEVLNLCNEVKAVVELLCVLAEEKKQNIITDISVIVMVKADRYALRQALLNIIDNAIKFTPDSGSIRVTVKLLQKTVAVVEIFDQGPGINPKDQTKIFNRFYRIDKSRSSGYGGTGLGLSIAKWAVEVIGGKIEVESELGKGSRFRILLPTAE
jgi:heavy metal sensor kinase